jgi:flagellar hook-associated protein 3 FlgL
VRISDQQITAAREYQVNAAYERLSAAQTVVSTDRRINAPADDPNGTAVALELQGRMAQTTQFSSTADATLSWLQSTDSALNGVNSVVSKARTLAVQGANDTLTASERQALAAQVGQLIQEGIQSANTDYAGQYVLAGYQTGTVPFVLNGSTGNVDYNGDGGNMIREVNQGVTMQINMPGANGKNGTGPVPTAFVALLKLQSDLQSGNVAGIGGADLAALDQASSGVLLAQATNGAAIGRVTVLQTTLQTQQTTYKAQYSGIVDADFAQATIDYNTQQATYEAALTVAGKSVEPSLLAFLK